jgi:hypothetical protein
LEAFIEKILLPYIPADHMLVPAVLLLAERAGHGRRFTAEQHRKWRKLLMGKAWVPLRGAPGEFAELASVFKADQPPLKDFAVVKARTAVLSFEGMADSEAVFASCLAWGLKSELTWQDVVDEARSIDKAAQHHDPRCATAEPSDTAPSIRLLNYIDRGSASITIGCGMSRDQALLELRGVVFVPAETSSPCAPGSETPERGRPFLSSPDELLPYSSRRFVWAAFPTASPEVPASCGLPFKKLELHHIVQQIAKMAVLKGPDTFTVSSHVVGHMFVACQELHALLCQSGLGTSSSADVKSVTRTALIQELERHELIDTEWVPVETESGQHFRLMRPTEAVFHWEHDLSPCFGRLSGRWREDRSVSDVMKLAGVVSCFDPRTLVEMLGSMAKQAQDGANVDVRVAINLVCELARIIRAHPAPPSSVPAGLSNPTRNLGTIFVPTCSGMLRPATSVFIDDAPWSGSLGAVDLLNQGISNEIGLLLGCTSVRAELGRRCEVDSPATSESAWSEDFGQHEELSSRIVGLLNDYNKPSDLFTEHWQNCDDAGAEAVAFILDARKYGCEQLVDERVASLQGPALLLASSKALGDEDIARI